ncbi:laminin subunit gamma-1 [Cricetulus griseus]|nr:laminin subunit gamma-1 [Cricetulus griseus]
MAKTRGLRGLLQFSWNEPVLSCALPDSTGQLDTVDLNKLNEIEGTLNKAKDEMKVSDLDRKVADLESEARKQEAAIMDYNRDIEEIIKDIHNLEDIKKTLPSGCFNTPSIEKP